jgi:mono/diheme cytochrome c family protein
MSIWKLAIPVLIADTGFIAMPQERPENGAGNSFENELSGAEMCRTYCASCHGIDGKGSGPVAMALRKAHPDLTQISKRNKGQFPAFRITHITDGYGILAVRGSRDMPVWGDYFRDNKQRDESILKLREHNLTEYIRSMQRQ